jgi:hypothetical protein
MSEQRSIGSTESFPRAFVAGALELGLRAVLISAGATMGMEGPSPLVKGIGGIICLASLYDLVRTPAVENEGTAPLSIRPEGRYGNAGNGKSWTCG